MFLVIGDSFAYWAGRRCAFRVPAQTAGWRGGCISDDRFRRWAVATVLHLRPQRVLLIVGGNDLARVPFSPRHLLGFFRELTLGLLAAGAEEIHVFPVPPRTSTRPGAASVSAFRRRRRLVNMLLRRLFARPAVASPVAFCAFQPAESFVGADGVHPSRAGWQAITDVAEAIATSSPLVCPS